MTSGRIRVSAARRAIVAVAWLATVAGAILLIAATRIGETDLVTAPFTLVFLGLAFDVVAFGTVGAVLALRRPGNAVGIVLIAAGLLIVGAFLGFIFGAVLTSIRGADDSLAGLVSLVGALCIDPALIVAGPLLALLFPDGRLPGPRWRWPVGAIAAMLAVGSVLVIVRPGPLGDSLGVNPFGVTNVPWVETLAPLGETLEATALLASLLLALVAVIVRLRRSRDAEREQLKWFVAANLVVVVGLFLSIADGATDPTAFDILAVVSLSFPPIAVGTAILRYRLYEIDRIISRTLAYAAVTGILFGIFVVVNLTLQAWLSPLLGAGGSVAVAVSTLLVAALFNPIRGRVQRVVDRRFDRARYHADRTVAAFAGRLREEMDLATIADDLGAIVVAAMAPSGVNIWVRETHR